MTIALLRNPVQKYDWGSLTEIAALQGRPPATEPEAELWMGAYPESSSLIFRNDQWQPLANHLTDFVSSAIQDRFGPRLPFLMKYLAVARPLSIQVHPDDEGARKGFSEGAFKDPYGKPELICALSTMELLCGFRDESEVAKDLLHLGREDLANEVETTSTGELFVNFLKNPDASFLDSLKNALHLTRDRAWLAEMLIKHPNDTAAMAPLFMNHVILQPGHALYVPTGTTHCYLSGFGVEVMASSDNVIRAGLTSKPVDLPHFLEHANLDSTTPVLLSPEKSGPWDIWNSPSPEFQLRRASVHSSITVSGLSIVAATQGDFFEKESGLRISQGESAIVAEGATIELSGAGELFSCSLNQ